MVYSIGLIFWTGENGDLCLYIVGCCVCVYTCRRLVQSNCTCSMCSRSLQSRPTPHQTIHFSSTSVPMWSTSLLTSELSAGLWRCSPVIYFFSISSSLRCLLCCCYTKLKRCFCQMFFDLSFFVSSKQYQWKLGSKRAYHTVHWPCIHGTVDSAGVWLRAT